MSKKKSIEPDFMIVGTAVMDVLSGIFYENEIRRIGGKALNQAVALARLGGAVSLVTALGDDNAAQQVETILNYEGIDGRYIRHVAGRQFLVTLEEFALGRVIKNVSKTSSLNEALTAAVFRATEQFGDVPKVLSTTFEVEDNHLNCIWEYAKKVKKSGSDMSVIVNPAPLPPHRGAGVLEGMNGVVDVLVPNRTEASALLGRQINDFDAEKSAQDLRTRLGVHNVCITLGSGGAVFASEQGSGQFRAIPIECVEKVGASDVFIAAFELAFLRDHTIPECVAFAGLCAGLSVSKKGGLESAPRLNEVAEYIDATRYFDGRTDAIAVFESLENANHA